MAEFRAMIEKISNNFKQQESRSLALCIQESLFRSIRNKNGRTANRGIKSAPFVVLLGADMPSVLAEVTCLSNKKEEEKLPTQLREEIGYLRVNCRILKTKRNRSKGQGVSKKMK
jgi:N-acetylmuramoyl-L-alanine amidase